LSAEPKLYGTGMQSCSSRYHQQTGLPFVGSVETVWYAIMQLKISSTNRLAICRQSQKCTVPVCNQAAQDIISKQACHLSAASKLYGMQSCSSRYRQQTGLSFVGSAETV
jgi:hypothetical protein